MTSVGAARTRADRVRVRVRFLEPVPCRPNVSGPRLPRPSPAGITAVAGRFAGPRRLRADASRRPRGLARLPRLARQPRPRPWVAPDFRDPELSWHPVDRPPGVPDDRTASTRATARSSSGSPASPAPGRAASRPPPCPCSGSGSTTPGADQLPDLVRRYALQKLEGLRPGGPRPLPPAGPGWNLTRDHRPGAGDASPAEPAPAAPPTLARVAEPLGDRAARKGFARAWGREPRGGRSWSRAAPRREGERPARRRGRGRQDDAPGRRGEGGRAAGGGGATGRRSARSSGSTSAGRLVAGMKYLGQWEERVEAVIAELGRTRRRALRRAAARPRPPGRDRAGRQHRRVPRPVPGPRAKSGSRPRRRRPNSTPAAGSCPGCPTCSRSCRCRPFDPGRGGGRRGQATRRRGRPAPGSTVERRRTGERIVRLFRRFQPYAAAPRPGRARSSGALFDRPGTAAGSRRPARPTSWPAFRRPHRAAGTVPARRPDPRPGRRAGVVRGPGARPAGGVRRRGRRW